MTMTASDITHVIQRIAPQWPLPATVAVNPYHGLLEMGPAQAAMHIVMTTGTAMAGDPALYKTIIQTGKITDTDVHTASQQTGISCSAVSALRSRLDQVTVPLGAMPTYLGLATRKTGLNWMAMYTDHTGDWIADWCDTVQARLQPTRSFSLWMDWVLGVIHDRRLGSCGFQSVIDLAAIASQYSPTEWIAHCVESLTLGDHTQIYTETRLHQLIGWASALSSFHFNQSSQLDDHRVVQFLAIALTWDMAAKSVSGHSADLDYQQGLTAYIDGVANTVDTLTLAQFAMEAASRRQFLNQIVNKVPTDPLVTDPPKVQAVFCIDVRSERIRRHIESLSDTIQTRGFAGFFGALVSVLDPTLANPVDQAPVLFHPAHTLHLNDVAWISKKTDLNRWWDAWRGFKENAISCFSYMGPMGLTHLPDMIRASFKRVGRIHPTQHHDRYHALAEAVLSLPISDQVAIASGFLSGIGMTQFSPITLIVGHGASMVNNPHVSAYDCGACGGRSGSTNAIIASVILNSQSVRLELDQLGIKIPSDSRFYPMLHNTTTDEVVSLDPINQLDSDLLNLLTEASHRTRLERGLSNPLTRSVDWSELRPEWGLINCHWFIAAPRPMTQNITLSGQAFLHDYDPNLDIDQSILETILTAPVTVATWINMAYNAAVWAPDHFGGGNKWRHNLTSGVGVTEGISGDLRIGLPKQAIHDGQEWVHTPQRLGVILYADPASVRRIIGRHQSLRDTVCNRWIAVYTIDPSGHIVPIESIDKSSQR